MTLSKHAQKRLQHRAISLDAVRLIFTHGSGVSSYGEELVYLEECMIHELAGSIELPISVSKLKKIYLIVDGNTVITVAYNTKNRK